MKKFYSAALCSALVLTLSLPLTAATVGKVSTNSTGLNVRSGAGTGYSIVSSAPKNTYLTIESEKDGWLKVRYGENNYGWVSDDYITDVPSKTRYVTTTYGKLNVRSGASKNYSVLTRLPKGTEVLVISESGGWSKIVYNGNKVGIDGPCASLRLDIIRDGLEDCEMLRMADEVLGREWVLAKVNAVTKDLKTYTESGEFFTAVRNEIGNELEKALNK